MSLTAGEIEYGRLAIERNLATREQVRECADLRAAGNAEHLARLLVGRGYLSEVSARELYSELSARGSGAYVSQPGSAGGSAFGAAGSHYGSAPGSSGGIHVTCPACGAPSVARSDQAGDRIRCAGCAGPVPVPSPYGAHDTGAYGSRVFKAEGPNGTHGQGYGSQGYGSQGYGSQGYGSQGYGSQGYAQGANGSAYGPNGTHGHFPGGGTALAGGAAPGSAPLIHDTNKGSGFHAGGDYYDAELPPNLAPDDPIAHAMAVRQNADGSTETVFGPYDVLGEIARGGMGIVYRARQRSLKRIVALKVMKEGENASEKQIRRFKRETEAAAKLQHPNIVAVHEVGCHEGFHYFTMDLIEGDPLDAIIKRGEKMPVDRVLQIVMEVAQAIHYAHGKGIIHRDLKPANVLLDTDGHPKVTDFGLAKNIDHKSMLTRTGAVVGTPFYMPPEQARGDVDIDQRADVYALGVILYELLTLKLPFHGETTMEVYHKILEEEPLPPRKHDTRLNRDVDTIVLKAMEKDLSRRYQTSQELAEDIQRYLNGDPIKARPLGPIGLAIKKAKKNMPVVVVASVTVLALAGSVGMLYWRYVQSQWELFQVSQNTEWDTFVTEVENHCHNARAQISTGIARQRDRDPEGALADLGEALRILDELPFLAKDYTTYNELEATNQYLRDREREIAAIYRDVYLEMGKAHVLKHDEASYAQALESFAKGLEYDAKSLDLHLEVGRVQALQERFDEALATLAGILDEDPLRMDARLEVGRVHDQAGAPLEALEAFTWVIEYDDGPVAKDHLVRAHLLRGQTRYSLGRYDEAVQDFDRVLDLKDDAFDGYVWRGRVHQALGKFSEAQEDLTEAIDLNPSLPDGYYHRAELYFAQRKHAEAIKDYEVAISRSAQSYRAYLGLGRALEWVLEYDRARQQYEEVLRATDREAARVAPAAHAALAALDLVQADGLECRQEEEERIRQETATPDGAAGPPPPLDTLLEAADALERKRLQAAAQGFERALALAPDLIEARLGRARLALRQGQPGAAREHLEAAREALDARLTVRYGRDDDDRKTVEEDDGWADDDWEAWDAGAEGPRARVDVDVSLRDVQNLLGLVALREGKLDEAQRAFEAALEADASSAFAKAGLGHVALEQEQEEDARALFAEARTLAAEGIDEAGYFCQEGLRYQGLASRSKKPEYYQQARRAFARAQARNPLEAQAYLARARLNAEWSAHDVAVTLAQQAAEVDPFLRQAYELQGFLFTRDLPERRHPETGRPENIRDYTRGKERFDRAIAVAEGSEAAADSHYGRALANLALAEDDADPRLQEARADLEQAAQAIPEDFTEAEPHRINQSIAYLERLTEVYERLGLPEEAARAKGEVERVQTAAREAATQELEEGRVLRDRLNYSEAIKHFDRAIELNPKFDDAYYDRGTCYLKIGNFVPGILDFSRALELNPRIADQVYNKVYQISYVVDLNRVITELNKIVSDHPDESYVIFLRGFFYVAKTEFKRFDRSDLELGIADFDRCLELNPTHVTALLYRGFLFYKMAALEEDPAAKEAAYDTALENYHQALELDPESGISHYLQALLWSYRSGQEGLDEATVEELRQRAYSELAASFESDFKGYERIKNERGFDPIRNEPEFVELMRGK